MFVTLSLVVMMVTLLFSPISVNAGSHDQDLLTIQNSVDTRSQQFIDYYYDMGIQPETNPSGVISYTLAALSKNQDVANANQRLIDMLAISSWEDNTLNPQDQVFYFEIPNLMRIWYLFNQNSSFYPGRLTASAETAMKEWIFEHANACSIYTDADLSHIWQIDGSENHDLVRRGTYFFLTDALKDDANYKDLVIQDGNGYTVAEHAAAWAEYYTVWFNERARKGTFIEIASTIYMKYSMPYIYNMRDFGPNSTMRDHADQFITLVFADYAQEYMNGIRAGSKARAYRGKYSNYGMMDSIYDYSHLYYNLGSLTNIDKNGGAYTTWSAATSDYRVPLEVMDIALYPDDKGIYEYISTRPASDPNGYYLVEFPSNLRRYSYVTPGYINGVFTIDTGLGSYNSGDYILLNEQNRWMGVMFNGNKDTRAYLEASDGEASAYSDMNGIADGNAMILQKPSIAVRDGGTKISLSVDLYNQKTESNGWIFTNDPNGTGYLAVKPASGTITSWSDYVWNRGPIGTYVSNGTSAGVNYELSTDLKVKNSASDGSITYLNIGHPGDVEVESSILRLYANDISGTPVVEVYGITDDTWDRETMTWNSGAPNHGSTGYSVTGVGTTATLITSQTIDSGQGYYEFDVTSFANSQIATSEWHMGDTSYSFMLVCKNDDGSYVTFNSSNATDNKPELESVAGKYANLSDEHTPVVFQTGLSSDYANFDSFKTDVLNNTFRWNSSTEFEYQGTGSANLKYYTDTTLPKLDNVTIDLNPSKTYDSPYLSADYDSPVVTITNTSNETLTLDFSIPGYPTQDNNLVGWWALDETSGTTASDSENTYDGTVSGASWTTGNINNALSFDGVDDYVELPTTTQMSSSTGSVSMWINSSQDYTNSGMIFYGAGDVNGNGFGSGDELHVHFNSDETLGLFIQGDTQSVNIVSDDTYADGQWHHVAATWDINGEAILYIDGAEVASANHDANVFNFSASMRLGTTYQTGIRSYEGLLDQVKVYEGVLSTTDVGELINEGPGLTPVEPDGHWNLNETSGTTANDASSNNYDGAVSGATWATGYMNNGLSFDGVNDYVQLPTTTNMSSSEGSVSLWINSSHNYTDHGMMFYGALDTIGNGYGSHKELHLNFLSDETIGFFIEGGSQDVNITTSGTYADGQWHHVAATWNINGDATLYIDGTEVASATHDAIAFDFSGVMRLGQTANNTRYYSGLMDQVKIYETELSAAQIQLLADEN